MKLREALEQNLGEIVKVGADAAFIYADICDESTIKYIENYDKDEIARLEENLKRTRTSLDNFDEIWTQRRNKRINRELKKDPEFKNKERVLENIKIEKEKEHTRLVKYESSLIKRINEYIPIIDREVREIYKAFYGGKIILFKGLEVGKYWTVSEFREDRGV